MTSEARPLRLGTRGSDLARRQTHLAIEALVGAGFAGPVEVVIIRTSGDEAQVPARYHSVGAFTTELECALRDGRIDAAVHSLKDLPVGPRVDLTLGAIMARDDPSDALVDRGHRTLLNLPAGARVGTSSLRRRALLLARRPDLVVVDIRGNVPTRLQLVDNRHVDAVVVALAGLNRLNQRHRVTEVLSLDSWLPAPGQGALALEVRADDERTLQAVRSIDHGPSRLTTAAERAFLSALHAGCRAPVGAHATVNDRHELRLRGCVAALDGHTVITDCIEAVVTSEEAAVELGARLVTRVSALGARRLLEAARRDLDDERA